MYNLDWKFEYGYVSLSIGGQRFRKVRFKTNYHASRLRFLFFRFLNGPLRCLDQRYRFK